jgi:CDP-paratose 2-epimerase
MPRLLVTGAGGLVGATSVEHFTAAGWEVTGIENGARRHLLGPDGDTLGNIRALQRKYPRVRFVDADVRSPEAAELVRQADAIIHCAAQTSHPRSVEIPLEDADINIRGTLNLLEALRQSGRKDVPFVFCSTNKVYGDAPNELPYVERATRFELKDLPHGIDETLRIDATMHTPFGVSKAAADLYTQEYGLLYGLPAGSFRMGCITGPWSRATVFQNWIAYFIRCALSGRRLTVFGYGGKQVRDNIDARDLVRAFHRFIDQPRPGQVYNLGGGPANSVSCLETIARIERMTGKRMDWGLGPEREADHRIYITDTGKFERDYPGWKIEIGLDRIFDDLLAWVGETLREPAAEGVSQKG